MNKRNNIIILAVLSIIYFLLFVPPNLTGTKNTAMLVAFEFDEFINIHPLMEMTAISSTFSETLTNILHPGTGFYGYPFFLLSAIVIIPLKLIYTFTFVPSTDSLTYYMLLLRQQSPLFMLLAIFLLIYMWTGFKDLTRSVFLLVFLSSIPAIFDNNMWWHPESLATLFIIATILSFYKDNLDFGKWFYLAAFFCGIATGIKVLGVFFFLTLVTYLILGLTTKKITFTNALKYGGVFFVIMVAAIIISNPMIVKPEVAELYFSKLSLQANINKYGWGGIMWDKGPTQWYQESLKSSFGFWWTYLLVTCFCLLGIIYDHQKRLLNIIILTWILPLSFYLLFFVVNKYSRYFLPIFLPLMSCAGNPVIWNFKKFFSKKKKVIYALVYGVVLLFGFQFYVYTKNNIVDYTATITREKSSPPITFYRELDKLYFSNITPNTKLTVFRDPCIYLPPMPNVGVAFLFRAADHEVIKSVNPHLILLQKEFIELYEDKDTAVNAGISVKPKDIYKMRRFYKDAKNNSIEGYHKIMETDFGTAFARRDHLLHTFDPVQQNKVVSGLGNGVINDSSSFAYYWLEAENADTIVAPLEIAKDEKASGGRYIYAPQGTGNQYSPGPAIAQYHVKISQAGEYILWGRGKAIDGRSDSFFVQVDDGFNCRWKMSFGWNKRENPNDIRKIKKVDTWLWDKIGDRGNIDFMVYSLAAGEHTIKIKLREDGAKIDKLLLTNNLDFVPEDKGNMTENAGYPPVFED